MIVRGAFIPQLLNQGFPWRLAGNLPRAVHCRCCRWVCCRPALPRQDRFPTNIRCRTCGCDHPKAEAAVTHLQPGYHLELVASDPDLISPVLCVWDGDGRMYVAEMRSYMLDINGVDEHQPNSRVFALEDTQGNGTYDQHTVFADKLILPRMVLPLDDRILIRETDTKDIYSYRDTKGTGVADEKRPFYIGGPRRESRASAVRPAVEHRQLGLPDRRDERFRYKDGKFEMGKLPMSSGQWGIAMDDTGRLIFAAGRRRTSGT